MRHDEVAGVLGELRGANLLIAKISYGTGLKLSECLRLRTKDIDFDQMQIVLRHGKEQKDRLCAIASEEIVFVVGVGDEFVAGPFELLTAHCLLRRNPASPSASSEPNFRLRVSASVIQPPCTLLKMLSISAAVKARQVVVWTLPIARKCRMAAVAVSSSGASRISRPSWSPKVQ